MVDSFPHRRIVISNLDLGSDNGNGKTEPGVEVVTDNLVTENMFDGLLQRTKIGTVSAVPASNEGLGLPVFADVPGSGIVLPGGVNVYFLDLAPGYTTPMHRTPSVDYVAVTQGTPVLITPKAAFSANNDQADYEETVESLLRPGDVAVQRGAMHSTNEWVRMIGMVVDAKPSEATVDGKRLELGERWLQ
ncbi:cupin [Colletotrichum melonis]|uniref:Cupin n=1 Tax=Colletotrichum melonis TaxID=1209925 RepID=A0AAI9UQ79_9PEZI|nr:cupin [Colletotrichum melonis]